MLNDCFSLSTLFWIKKRSETSSLLCSYPRFFQRLPFHDDRPLPTLAIIAFVWVFGLVGWCVGVSWLLQGIKKGPALILRGPLNEVKAHSSQGPPLIITRLITTHSRLIRIKDMGHDSSIRQQGRAVKGTRLSRSPPYLRRNVTPMVGEVNPFFEKNAGVRLKQSKSIQVDERI